MFPPLDVWAPIFRAPFSGNVTQEIVPRLFSPDIKGVPEIEHKIQTEVASYGTQLGIVLRTLDTLCQKAKVSSDELTDLIANVETAKAESRDMIKSRAQEALDRLRAQDPEAYQDLLATAAEQTTT